MGLKDESLQVVVREQHALAKELANAKLDREREEKTRNSDLVKENEEFALQKEKLRVELEFKKLELEMK